MSSKFRNQVLQHTEISTSTITVQNPPADEGLVISRTYKFDTYITHGQFETANWKQLDRAPSLPLYLKVLIHQQSGVGCILGPPLQSCIWKTKAATLQALLEPIYSVLTSEITQLHCGNSFNQ